MPRINATGSIGLRVHGLASLNRTLRSMGPEFQQELKDANREAAEMVASHAKAAAYSLGGVAGHVAPSIRASSSTTRAGVSIGGARYPMAAGAEFGAYRYKQFKPWRGNGADAGYFLYPSIRNDSDRIVDTYVGALDDLIDRNRLG